MENDPTYTKVTDASGLDYYCPISTNGRADQPQNIIEDDCVETDVVHRYSGNIRVA